MQAVILVGGLGTRLRSVVSDLPKPMAPVRGKPFLAYILSYLERQGIDEVILATGYLGDKVMAAFGNHHGTLNIRYSVEDAPLGTGGAMRQAFRLVTRWPVFVVNGDTFLALDYQALRRAHDEAESELTIALHPTENAERYGGAVVKNDRVVAFEAAGRPGPGLINSGVYLFARDLLENAGLPAAFSFENDFIMRNAPTLRPLAFETDAYFIDIGVPEDYRRAQHELTEAN